MPGFIESTAPAAVCVSDGRQVRNAATRVWAGCADPSPAGTAEAHKAAKSVTGATGKVLSAGVFSSDSVHRCLANALPAQLRAALRPRFERYYCAGAYFHNDAHYSGVLFGAWCILGPEREVVFPRLSIRTPAGPSNLVVFDPFEPHAVLRPGERHYAHERYETDAMSEFIGFELELLVPVRRLFGIAEPVADAMELSSRVRINAQTGATTIA